MQYYISPHNITTHYNASYEQNETEEEEQMIYLIIPSSPNISPGFSIAMATIFIFIIVTSVVGNLVLILTIISTRKLHSITHTFIVNLAVVDLVTACFVIPYDVNFMIRGYYSYDVIECGIMHTTFLMSLPLAILNLTLLTIERFVTITFPFKVEEIFTKRNIILALLTTWIYTLIVSLFPIMYNKNALVSHYGYCQYEFPNSFSIFHGTVNFLLPIVIIAILNFVIFRIANFHEKKIKVTYKDCPKQRRRKKGNLLLFRKGAKRIILLVSGCMFCWLPYIVLVIWNVACQICHPRELTWIGNAVNYMSVILNPLLYGLCNQPIRREAMKKILKLTEAIRRPSLNGENSRNFTTAAFTNSKHSEVTILTPKVGERHLKVATPLLSKKN